MFFALWNEGCVYSVFDIRTAVLFMGSEVVHAEHNFSGLRHVCVTFEEMRMASTIALEIILRYSPSKYEWTC